MTIVERFMAKVSVRTPGGCWEWTACRGNQGYGFFGVGGKNRLAHRVAYELFVGPIPDGLVLDHLCRVRHCVNPKHLEPVTSAENSRRGDVGDVHQAAKTHCAKGHPYSPDNTYERIGGGRDCRTCRRERNLAYYYRKKAA